MKKLILSATLLASISISVTVLPTATAQTSHYAPHELHGSCYVQYDNGPIEEGLTSDCYYPNGQVLPGVGRMSGPYGPAAFRRYVTAGTVPNTGFYANNTGFHPGGGNVVNYAPAYQGRPQVVYGGQPQGYAPYPQGNGYPPGYRQNDGFGLDDAAVSLLMQFGSAAMRSSGDRFGDKIADDWLGVDPNDHRPRGYPQHPQPGGQPGGQRMCYNNQSPELFPCPN